MKQRRLRHHHLPLRVPVSPSPHSSSLSSTSLVPSTVPPLRLAPSTEERAASPPGGAASARPPTQARPGRRRVYLNYQGLDIVRTVVNAKAHVAGFGETRKRFKKRQPYSTTIHYSCRIIRESRYKTDISDCKNNLTAATMRTSDFQELVLEKWVSLPIFW